MTTKYFTINPPTGDTQEISIPVDSIVYFSVKKEDFPNIWFPMLFLDEELIGQYWRTWMNYNVNDSSAKTYPVSWVKNGMAVTKFWLGYVPFESTFNAQIKGQTKVIGGDSPQEVTRTTYEKPDGTIFSLDIWMQTVNFSYWYKTKNVDWSGNMDENVQNVIVRDSNGIQIGGYSRTYGLITITKPRPHTVQGPYCYSPITSYGTIPFTPYAKAESQFSPTEATQVGDSETVSITDYFTYVPATPITIPMHFSCTEKSYSYIQF